MLPKKQKGFTLIELMIVVAIIAILAAIAIPAFLRAKITANEGAAIATSKSLFTYEELCRSSGIIDMNTNGTGEYGTLGEISGTYRRSFTSSGGIGTGVPQPFTPATLRPKAIGFANKSGYSFKVFLPSQLISPITDVSDLNASSSGNSSDAILQESRFRIYGWPIVFNNSGIRCFAIDQNGEVLVAQNTREDNTFFYNGTTIPLFGAAVAVGNNAPPEIAATFNGLFISGSLAIDTQRWTVTGN